MAYGSIHGTPENLDSFKDDRMKVNYRKATEEYINLLLETIEVEPEKYGYEFGRWTTAIALIKKMRYNNSSDWTNSKYFRFVTSLNANSMAFANSW